MRPMATTLVTRWRAIGAKRRAVEILATWLIAGGLVVGISVLNTPATQPIASGGSPIARAPLLPLPNKPMPRLSEAEDCPETDAVEQRSAWVETEADDDAQC
jgi:hypothetical protein